MHTDLIKHQIVAYQEREAQQRSEALVASAYGRIGEAGMYTRAADWTALKIAELQRRVQTQCSTCPATESTCLGLQVPGGWRCVHCYKADYT